MKVQKYMIIHMVRIGLPAVKVSSVSPSPSTGILKKWEVPPLRKVNEHLEDVDKSIKKLGKAAQETR